MKSLSNSAKKSVQTLPKVLKKAKKVRVPQQAATPTEQAVGRIVGSVCVITAKQGECFHWDVGCLGISSNL